MVTILVVDDELAVREMVAAMVEPSGHAVIMAGNGDEALAVCGESPVDLIITDIVMPKKNGIDLIMAVKKQFPQLPVIAISGGGGLEGRYDYLEIAKLVGANNILRKPFPMELLRSTIDNIINNKDLV